ncbi:MAG: hypothetical protein JWM74_918 [Myxococcaceae bacterium]|nr:hypothetical protein [Myxococcaceae bacterium]
MRRLAPMLLLTATATSCVVLATLDDHTSTQPELPDAALDASPDGSGDAIAEDGGDCTTLKVSRLQIRRTTRPTAAPPRTRLRGSARRSMPHAHATPARL